MRKLFLFLLFLPAGLMSVQAGQPKLVATISIVGDVVRNVAGPDAALAVLVGPDGDAHEYEPVPADSVSIAGADIIFENGLHLEHWLDKLYEASGSRAKRVVVSRGVKADVMNDNPQETDPHAWQDVDNVMIYTRNIRDALIAFDRGHQAQYMVNANAYLEQLQSLQAWVKAQVAFIPLNRRALVTNHDALGYFARAYGFRIIGAVIPSATTEAGDPSAQQTARLLDIIKANGVHTVFSENMANPKLVQTLAKEANAVVGPELYTDALGPKGSEGETYIKMIRHNVRVLRQYLK